MEFNAKKCNQCGKTIGKDFFRVEDIEKDRKASPKFFCSLECANKWNFKVKRDSGETLEEEVKEAISHEKKSIKRAQEITGNQNFL